MSDDQVTTGENVQSDLCEEGLKRMILMVKFQMNNFKFLSNDLLKEEISDLKGREIVLT